MFSYKDIIFIGIFYWQNFHKQGLQNNQNPNGQNIRRRDIILIVNTNITIHWHD